MHVVMEQMLGGFHYDTTMRIMRYVISCLNDAFSGCDVVTTIHGKAKISAWNVCDEVSNTLTKFSQCPPAVTDNDLQILEMLVVVMYDRSSPATCVNDARLDIFARKQRSYDSIPPTRAALKGHTKRGIIWGQATLSQPHIQSPADMGWNKKGDMWQICWATLPPIATSCQEQSTCSCKIDCRGRCKCFCCGLTCTSLCSYMVQK